MIIPSVGIHIKWQFASIEKRTNPCKNSNHSNSRAAIEKNDNWVHTWLTSRFYKYVVKLFLASSINHPAVPFRCELWLIREATHSMLRYLACNMRSYQQ
jgi:hypothetical protein